MKFSIWLADAAIDPDKPGRLFGNLLPWLIMLVGFVFVGGVVIFYIRRWMKNDAMSNQSGFTLQDLRDMHRRGELTVEQFNAAKLAMVGRLTKPPSTVPTGEKPAAGSENEAGNHEQSSE